MKPYTFLILLTITFFITISCKENINNIIEAEIEPEPGSRNYVWTADTIKDRAWFNKFVGEAVNDIWAVNSDGTGNDCVYRFNGNNWLTFDLGAEEPLYDLLSAYKYNNKIWFTSRNGEIWFFSNGAIKKTTKFFFEQNELYLFDITGKSENEIYAAGARGVGYNRDGSLCYYDGSKWVQKGLFKGYGGFYMMSYSSKNNRYYLAGYIDHEVDDTTRVYEYDGNKLTAIWETTTGETCLFTSIDGYLFVTLKNSVYRYYKNKFELLFTENSQEFAGAVAGRSKNDLIVTAYDGIKHWNGSDLVYIKKLPKNIFVKHKMIVLEKDVFFETKDNNSNYDIIYHGKLK